MLRLLGRPTSINVRKVLWTLDELGLPFEIEPWGSGDLALNSPEFRALNPDGLVPVLVDDGFVLTQSNVICRYLAMQAGRTDLLPAAPRERVRVEEWMDWGTAEVDSAARYAFMNRARNSPRHTDPAAVEASVAAWNGRMARLDTTLASAGGGYLLGPTLTLADVVVGLWTHRWYATPIERPPLTHVRAYYERLCTLPAFGRHGNNGLP